VRLPRTGPLLSLLLLAACACPVQAQGGDLGPTPAEEEKLRLCPELKEAQGRTREQLEALFFQLDPTDFLGEGGEAKAAKVRALFDLGAEADAKLLVAQLDGEGTARCLPGLQAVLVAHGPQGLVWLLERLAATPAPRRGRLIACLAAFHEREAWRVLLALLSDKTPVPNPKGAAQAPPGYADLRVCDHALRALAVRLRRTVPPPEGIEWKVDPLLPIAVRDKRVEALKAAAPVPPLSDQVAGRPTIREGLAPDAQARLDQALEALGAK
jgi:hypothetical protein